RHTRCYRDWSSDVCSSDLEKSTPGTAVPPMADQPTVMTVPAPSLLRTMFRDFVWPGAAVTLVLPKPTVPPKSLSSSVKSWLKKEIGRASCRERGWGSGVGG